MNYGNIMLLKRIDQWNIDREIFEVQMKPFSHAKCLIKGLEFYFLVSCRIRFVMCAFWLLLVLLSS